MKKVYRHESEILPWREGKSNVRELPAASSPRARSVKRGAAESPEGRPWPWVLAQSGPYYAIFQVLWLVIQSWQSANTAAPSRTFWTLSLGRRLFPSVYLRKGGLLMPHPRVHLATGLHPSRGLRARAVLPTPAPPGDTQMIELWRQREEVQGERLLSEGWKVYVFMVNMGDF